MGRQACVIARIELRASGIEVLLSDGAVLTIPLVAYPRLWAASLGERYQWQLSADRRAIVWANLDVVVSLEDWLRSAA